MSREVKALAWHVCHVSHSLPVSRRRSPREADTRHVGSSAICISHLHVYRAVLLGAASLAAARRTLFAPFCSSLFVIPRRHLLPLLAAPSGAVNFLGDCCCSACCVSSLSLVVACFAPILSRAVNPTEVVRIPSETRSSATVDGPRDALCQSKSCQL